MVQVGDELGQIARATQAGDPSELRLQRTQAEPLDRRLVHAARVVVADLLLRPVRSRRRLLEHAPEELVVALGQLRNAPSAADPPASGWLRSSRRTRTGRSRCTRLRRGRSRRRPGRTRTSWCGRPPARQAARVRGGLPRAARQRRKPTRSCAFACPFLRGVTRGYNRRLPTGPVVRTRHSPRSLEFP